MAGVQEFNVVVVAALLHDIGKLLQRGRSLAFDIEGPHPEVSARFVNAFSGTFSPLLDVELLKTLVQRHHRGHNFTGLRADDIAEPHSKLLAFLINKADGLSASERGQHTAQWQDFKTTPLASLFPSVFAVESKPAIANYHPLPLARTKALSERFFPDKFDEYEPGELEDARRQFDAAAGPLLKKLGTDFEGLVCHLLALLATHIWPVPADTQEEVPDISLYDHLRTTAAIAACLYKYYEAQGTLEEAGHAQPAEPFYLAVGDISGIQDYIFNIAAGAGGGIARRLRARSLFVQLISEVVPLQILNDFGLPLTNVLMASGGKFYLLLPHLQDTETRLAMHQERVDRWFLEELRASLVLNLAWVSFGEAGFQKFGDVMESAMRRLAERKELRFREAMLVNGHWATNTFLLEAFGRDQRACPSCDKFPTSRDGLCPYCEDDLKWGQRLPGSNYIALFQEPATGQRNIAGIGVTLCSNLTELKDKPSLVIQINDPDTTPTAQFPTSFRYLVNHVPTDDKGKLLEFENIAGKSSGRHYLAFLKADVDSLGEVFALGLRGNDGGSRKDTISRLATLSRQLDFFFTAWVQHLLASEFPNCYSVFSGGDDLFLVGPWDNILDLAGRLRQGFANFTCHNPRLTFSAGIVIAPHHYPINDASREVEEALDASKKEPEKNRITLLGHTLTWGDWQTIKAEWHRLKDEEVSSAFLYSLLEYGEMWRDYRKWVKTGGKEGSVLGLRFQPLLAYNIDRNLDSRKSPVLHQWARALVDYRQGEQAKELILDNLGLLAQLLILGKKGGER